MNSNTQTKFEFKSRKKKKKTEKKERRKRASQPARPARLHGPASNRPAPPARSSRPAHELAPAQQARTPLTPTCLPTFACCHCRRAPRVSRTRPQCRLPPPTAHADSPLRPSPDSTGRGGPGGHTRGMALSPWRHTHATTRGRWMQARAPDHPLIPIHRSPAVRHWSLGIRL